MCANRCVTGYTVDERGCGTCKCVQPDLELTTLPGEHFIINNSVTMLRSVDKEQKCELLNV